MASTSGVRQHAACIPPTNHLLLAAKPEPYQKAHLLAKYSGECFDHATPVGKSGRNRCDGMAEL